MQNHDTVTRHQAYLSSGEGGELEQTIRRSDLAAPLLSPAPNIDVHRARATPERRIASFRKRRWGLAGHRVAEGLTVRVVADETRIKDVRQLRREGGDATRRADRGPSLFPVL